MPATEIEIIMKPKRRKLCKLFGVMLDQSVLLLFSLVLFSEPVSKKQKTKCLCISQLVVPWTNWLPLPMQTWSLSALCFGSSCFDVEVPSYFCWPGLERLHGVLFQPQAAVSGEPKAPKLEDWRQCCSLKLTNRCYKARQMHCMQHDTQSNLD